MGENHLQPITSFFDERPLSLLTQTSTLSAAQTHVTTALQAKKNLEILTFVGLPDFQNGGSCGIRTYDQLVKRQLDAESLDAPARQWHRSL